MSGFFLLCKYVLILGLIHHITHAEFIVKS